MDRKRLGVSRGTTVIQCSNLAPFVFDFLTSSVHHFVRHQITVNVSRHSLPWSVFSRLIGESGKMPLVGMKFVIRFPTQLLLSHEAI